MDKNNIKGLDNPNYSNGSLFPMAYTGGYIVDEVQAMSFTPPILEDTKKEALPKKFNCEAPLDWVTPVKLQHINGPCWSFAAIAAYEAFLLKSGKTKADDHDNSIFSEMHMLYSIFDLDNGRGYHNPFGIKVVNNEYSGNMFFATSYFAGGGGTLNATDCYVVNKSENKITKRLTDITDNKERRLIPTKIIWFGKSGSQTYKPDYTELIKTHVYNCGAVAIGFDFDEQYFSEDTSCMPYRYSYYCPSSAEIMDKHALTIVGWDDNYSKTNFKIQPSINGAFYVKDSNGITMIDDKVVYDGYYWISYENKNFYDAYCFAEVKEDFYTNQIVCYRHDIVGMSYGVRTKENFITFKNVFNSSKDDSLTGIGLFCMTPCTASIELIINGITTQIVRRYQLPSAGYFYYELESPLKINAEKFAVKVRYDAVGSYEVMAPVEWRHDNNPMFDNVVVKPGRSYVNDVDVYDTLKSSELCGYVALRAFVRNSSQSSKDTLSAYNRLNVSASKNGYITGLICKSGSTNIDWRIEPYNIDTYSEAIMQVKLFQVVDPIDKSTKYGVVNQSGKPVSLYLCAVLGSSTFVMRKLFCSEIKAVQPPRIEYAVQYGTANVCFSGNFDVPGAIVTVQVECETQCITISAKVDGQGFWQTRYTTLIDDAWSEENGSIPATALFSDDRGVELVSSLLTVNIPKPYKEEGNKYSVSTYFGLVTAIAGVVAQGLTNIVIFLTNDITIAGNGLAGGLNVDFNANDHVINLRPHADAPHRDLASGSKATRFLFDKAFRVSNLKAIVQSNASFTSDGIGILVNTLTDGGSIENCTVSGSITGGGGVSGLIHKGNNVTIKNCEVNLNINKFDGAFNGIAHRLTGGSRVDGVYVSGNVNACGVAGIASYIENSTVSRSWVDMDVQSNGLAAGVGLDIHNSTIGGCAINGKFVGSSVAGVSYALYGGSSVNNCRVEAVISGSGYVAGISVQQEAESGKLPVIENCLSACWIKTLRDSPVACGISMGVKDHSECIKGCVVACDHINGGIPARIGYYNCGTNCVAYSGMRCDDGKQFANEGDPLISSELLITNIFAGRPLNWDFQRIWTMHSLYSYPMLRNVPRAQFYPYPFAYLFPNFGQSYVINSGIIATLKGICLYGSKSVTWSLRPRMESPAICGEVLDCGNSTFEGGNDMTQRGEGTLVDDNGKSFEIKLSIGIKGKYSLTVICLLESDEYEFTVMLEVK